MKNNALFCSNEQAVALSIGLHLSLLGLAYCVQFSRCPALPGLPAYTIALRSEHLLPNNHLAANKATAASESLLSLSAGIEKPSTKSVQKKVSSVKHHRRKQSTSGNLPRQARQLCQPPKIDERGLYNTGSTIAKQTDPILELKGWKWDAVPRPNDVTEECGKIVFEIKVDQDGEIVSIKAIEKTVTPLVEKIYADALRTLTFTKTGTMQAAISTGKVTFVLVGK